MNETVKNRLRGILAKASRCEPLYLAFWHPLSRLSGFVERERVWNGIVPSLSLEESIARFVPNRMVLHGPFRGMRYPNSEAVGSSLFPKLLGSYEQELHFLIEALCSRPYTNIVDIGCAEGYYAVGFAIRVPSARLYAFDINERGLDLCRQMTVLNGVETRVTFGGFCGYDSLLEATSGGKSLVVSDCEGFEIDLFTPTTIESLKSHDVLIEVHDFKNPRISHVLLERFRMTHEVTIIRSINDQRRPKVFHYAELDGISEDTQISLLAEFRPSDMEWFFFQPRSQ